MSTAKSLPEHSASASGVWKIAWIDEEGRIISFTRREKANPYCDEESAFWQLILSMMQRGYRIQ